MKARRIFSKVFIGLIFLITLSFTSCDLMNYVFDCMTCTKGNDSQIACGNHDQEYLENQGYTCQ
jgi:hypothetical protein